MRLKIFTADNMKAALAQVREALGDDAIIIDTSEEDGAVKVTAAMEVPTPKVRPRNAKKPRPKPAPVKKSLKELELDDNSERADLSFFLTHHGIAKAMTERILETAQSFEDDSNVNSLAHALDIMFHFSPVSNDYQRRPVMLVGPPGVGKTVTAAKLASQAVLAGRTIRLINTDTIRTGGTAQLEGYAEVLKTTVIEAPEPELLSAAIETNRQPDELVIIDTMGYNPTSRAEMAELHKFIQAHDVEPLLVIAAGADPQEAQEIAETYASLGVRRFIATRLDVARRYASLLTTAARADLAFAGIGLTPYLGSGIERLDALGLARLLTRIAARKIYIPPQDDTEDPIDQEGEES
ncbi:MAG TPA: AAA family ATPase [Sphingomonadales bacterium]|nr:AAA family ATPase [Sphingomonadales bacterium]